MAHLDLYKSSITALPEFNDPEFDTKFSQLIDSLNDEQVIQLASEAVEEANRIYEKYESPYIRLTIESLGELINWDDINLLRSNLPSFIHDLNSTLHNYNLVMNIFLDFSYHHIDIEGIENAILKNFSLKLLIAWILEKHIDDRPDPESEGNYNILAHGESQGALDMADIHTRLQLMFFLIHCKNPLEVTKHLMQVSVSLEYVKAFAKVAEAFVATMIHNKTPNKTVSLLISETKIEVTYLYYLVYAYEYGYLNSSDPLETILDVLVGGLETIIKQIIEIIRKLDTEYSNYLALRLETRYFASDENIDEFKNKIFEYINNCGIDDRDELIARVAGFFSNSLKAFESLLIDIRTVDEEFAKEAKRIWHQQNDKKYTSFDQDEEDNYEEELKELEEVLQTFPELRLLLTEDLDRNDLEQKEVMLNLGNGIFDINNSLLFRILNFLEENGDIGVVDSRLDLNLQEILFMEEYSDRLLELLEYVEQNGNEFQREWAIDLLSENFSEEDDEE